MKLNLIMLTSSSCLLNGRAIPCLAFKYIFTPMKFLNCFVHKGLAALLLYPNLLYVMLFQMLRGNFPFLVFHAVRDIDTS